MNQKRKNYINFLWLCLALIVVIFAFSYRLSNLNYYRISPENAKLFGISSPQEFCATQGENSAFEGRYIYAHVDSKGWLLLVMSDYQVFRVKNDTYVLEMLQAMLGSQRDIGVSVNWNDDPLGFLKDAPNCGLEFSSDFTRVVEGPDDLPWYYMFAVPGCAMIQILNGVPSDQVKVEYVVVDEYGSESEEIGWPPYEVDSQDTSSE